MVMNRIKRTDWLGGRWAVRRNSTRVGVSGASNVERFERLPNGNISHRRWRLMGIVSINILSSAARSAGPIQIRASETRIIEMRNNRHYVEDWNSYCREEGPSSDNCSAALRCSAVPSGCYHLLSKLPTQIFNSIEYENASRIYLKGLESQWNWEAILLLLLTLSKQKLIICAFLWILKGLKDNLLEVINNCVK